MEGHVMHPATREAYDRTWSLYPYEHPSAYWLRSDGHDIVCTRCSSRFRSGDRALEDVNHDAQAFTEKHLGCPLGYGLRDGGRPANDDPVFSL